MRLLKKILAFSIIYLACNFYNQASGQPFSLVNIPQHTASFSVSANCTVSISSGGGGSKQWQGSSVGTNGLYGTAGPVAESCPNQTGLRLEMSGAGNSSGTGVWDNSITVTFTFAQGVKGPATFNVYDITESIYYSSSNYATYQDKVTISSAKCDGAAIKPTLATNNGPVTSSTAGSSLTLTAIILQGQCKNQLISIGTATDLIKTITLVYSNQDPPNSIPSPVGSPPRYGLSQYQYVFISAINATPPDPISVSAVPNPICAGESVALAANSATAYTYTWSSGTSPVTGTPVTATPSTTTTYIVTGAIGTCTQTNSVNVTVNSTPIVPTFAAMGPYCVGASPGVLPGTSANGISGTWNPATITTAASGNSVYTFTPIAGQCASTTSMNITVTTSITPSFASISPFCSGTMAPVLPTSSTNAPPINGTWSPPTVSNTTSGTYTFTPNAGQCATTALLNVTVNPLPLANAGNDQTLCSGQTATLIATGGGTYLWSNNAGTATTTVNPLSTTLYTVTVTNGNSI